MNSTSFAEFGGNFARVVDGNDLVGWPGAPGWTTTGVAGSGDCAETDGDNEHASATAAMITPGHERNFTVKRKNLFIGGELSSNAGLYIITKRPRKRVQAASTKCLSGQGALDGLSQPIAVTAGSITNPVTYDAATGVNH